MAVLDDHGLRVELAAPAQRIASLSPSNTEILHTLGCGGRIVLRDRLSDYPPEVRARPATDPFQLSPEHVAGYRPDLVLVSHGDPGRLAALRRTGLVAASFDPRSFAQLAANVRAIGSLCGARGRAEATVRTQEVRLSRVAERVRGLSPVRVFVELDGSDRTRPWTAGPGSFVDELLRRAGAENVAAGLGKPYGTMSAEAVFAARPDVILVASTAALQSQALVALRSSPGWRALDAVRAGRVVTAISPDLLTRPGPRLLEGLEALVAALHPGSGRPAEPSSR